MHIYSTPLDEAGPRKMITKVRMVLPQYATQYPEILGNLQKTRKYDLFLIEPS